MKYNNMDSKDKLLLGMYCQKYEKDANKTLGGFFDSITKGVTKAVKSVSKAAEEIGKGAINVAKKGVDAAADTTEKLTSAGLKLATSPIRPALSSVTSLAPELNKTVSSLSPLLQTAAPIATAALTGGISPSMFSGLLSGQQGFLGNLVQGLIPQLGQMSSSGMQYVPQMVNPQQYMQSAYQQAYRPMQTMYNPQQYMNMPGYYNPMLAMQNAMPSNPMLAMQTGRTGSLMGSISDRLSTGGSLTSKDEYINVPYLNIFKNMIDNPKTMLAIIRFGILESPEKATANYMDTQKVMSLISGGEAPVNIARKKLMGQSISEKRNLGSLGVYDKTLKWIPTNFGKDGHILEEESDDWQLWGSQYPLGSLSAGDYGFDSIGDAERAYLSNPTLQAYMNNNAWDKLTSKNKERIKAMASGISLIDARKMKAGILPKPWETSPVAMPTHELVAMQPQTPSEASASVVMPTHELVAMHIPSETSSNILSQQYLKDRPEREMVDYKQSETLINKLENDSLANIVKANAINKLKNDSMSKVGLLAQQLAKQKMKDIQRATQEISNENKRLRDEVDRLTKQYNETLDKYRDSQLNQQYEYTKKLERDNNKLQEKLIKAFSSLDSAMNKAELLKNAVDKILANSSDKASLDYKNLAMINEEFKKQIQLINSLGIKEIDPTSVAKVYELLTSALKNNPNVIEALKEESGMINSMNKENPLSNSLTENSTRPNNPLLKPNTPTQITPKFSQGNLLGSNMLNTSSYPKVNLLMRLALAGYLLELARQMEVVNPEFSEYMFTRIQLKDRYEVSKKMLNTLIEEYMQGSVNVFDNSTTYADARIEEDLNKLISDASLYIKALTFRRPDFINNI